MQEVKQELPLMTADQVVGYEYLWNMSSGNSTMSKMIVYQWVGLLMDLLQGLYLIEFIQAIWSLKLQADVTRRWVSLGHRMLLSTRKQVGK